MLLLQAPRDTESQYKGHTLFWSAVTHLMVHTDLRVPRNADVALDRDEHISISIPADEVTAELEGWLDTLCEQFSTVWHRYDTSREIGYRRWRFRLAMTDAMLDLDLKPDCVPPWIWRFCCQLFMQKQSDGRIVWVACADLDLNEFEDDKLRVYSLNETDKHSLGWSTDDCRDYVRDRIPLPNTRLRFHPKSAPLAPHNCWIVSIKDLQHKFTHQRARL